MPMVMEDLLRESKTVAADTGWGDLNVKYRVGVWTEAFNQRVLGMNTENAKQQTFLEAFCELVEGWDFYATKADSESGKPVPLTVEALLNVPGFVLTAVLLEVKADQLPPRARPRPSSE